MAYGVTYFTSIGGAANYNCIQTHEELVEFIIKNKHLKIFR